MRKLKLTCAWLVFIAIPLWSSFMVSQYPLSTFRSYIDAQISLRDIHFLLHLVIILVWIFCAIQFVAEVLKHKSTHWALHRLDITPRSIAISAVALTASHNSIGVQATQATVPATTLVSPAVLAGLMSEILRTRRHQVAKRILPRQFSEHEQHASRKLITVSQTRGETSQKQDVVTHHEVIEVLRAVNEEQAITDVVSHPSQDWRVLVRLYGYPQVESSCGEIALFRKKRALELVSWLVLNRDRCRRSSARNALWDIDISDSSFSTVVSDMRRAISSLDPSFQRQEIVPVTYTDNIPLHTSVRSDFDLIQDSFNQFQKDRTHAHQLSQALSLVRDVPFAGTSYSWADYDGTTTRLVVTALNASSELASWALGEGHTDLALTAIRAGLRVMPGDEELLSLHKSLLSSVHTSRSSVSH